jgi:hypothetical protein
MSRQGAARQAIEIFIDCWKQQRSGWRAAGVALCRVRNFHPEVISCALKAAELEIEETRRREIHFRIELREARELLRASRACLRP